MGSHLPVGQTWNDESNSLLERARIALGGNPATAKIIHILWLWGIIGTWGFANAQDNTKVPTTPPGIYAPALQVPVGQNTVANVGNVLNSTNTRAAENPSLENFPELVSKREKIKAIKSKYSKESAEWVKLELIIPNACASIATRLSVLEGDLPNMIPEYEENSSILINLVQTILTKKIEELNLNIKNNPSGIQERDAINIDLSSLVDADKKDRPAIAKKLATTYKIEPPKIKPVKDEKKSIAGLKIIVQALRDKAKSISGQPGMMNRATFLTTVADDLNWCTVGLNGAMDTILEPIPEKVKEMFKSWGYDGKIETMEPPFAQPRFQKWFWWDWVKHKDVTFGENWVIRANIPPQGDWSSLQFIGNQPFEKWKYRFVILCRKWSYKPWAGNSCVMLSTSDKEGKVWWPSIGNKSLSQGKIVSEDVTFLTDWLFLAPTFWLDRSYNDTELQIFFSKKK